MKKISLIILFGLIFLSSCSVNLTIADTHGTASHLVDETSRTDASAEADIDVPIKPI